MAVREVNEVTFNILQDLCRLCGCHASHMQAILKEKSNTFTDIRDKNVYCTSIEVSESEKLPSQICETCANLLNTFYTFKARCLDINLELIEFIKKGNSATIDSSDMNTGIVTELLTPSEQSNGSTLHSQHKAQTSITQMRGPCFPQNKETTREEEIASNNNIVVAGDTSLKDILQAEMQRFPSKNSCSTNLPLSLSGFQAIKVELEEVYQRDPLELVTCSYASGLYEVKPTVVPLVSGHHNETLTHTENSDGLGVKKSDEFSSVFTQFSDKKCNKCGITIKRHEQTNGQICRVCLDLLNKINETCAMFECDICSKVFRTKLILSRHVKCHSKSNTFKCSVCNLKCNDSTALHHHLKFIHKENTNLKCTFCKRGKQYKSLRTLLNHMNKMHHIGASIASSTDEDCVEMKHSSTRSEGGSTFRAEEKRYKEKTRKAENLTCKICKEELEDQRALTDHVDSHKSNSKPKGKKQKESRDVSLCSFCGKVFNTGTLLYQHIRIKHLCIKKHKCKHCGKCFSTTSGLRNHVEAIHDKRKFQCALCGSLLSSSNGLQSHMRKHAIRNKEPTVKCPVCPKLFKHKKNVERHMRSHTGETPYKCSHCPREFTLQWNLIQHERLHTGEKRYKCEKCGKAFTHNVSRKNHMKYHKDESQG